MEINYIFSGEDLILGAIWLCVVTILAFIIRSVNSDKPDYKWFMPNFFFKMGMAFFFAYTFVVILGYGGDTVAYWEGAVKLSNLFWENPMGYVDEMISTPSRETRMNNFTFSTGLPPAWIYNEPESFFVSKVLSVFSLVTFKSYSALTVIIAFIAALASFRLYQLVRNYKFTKEIYMAGATMFIPTVTFSCSGISKDTIILTCLYFLLYHLFAIFVSERKFTWVNLLAVVFFIWLLANIRPFMLLALAPPILLGFGFGYFKRMSNQYLANILKALIVLSSVGFLALIVTGAAIPLGGGEEYLEEAAVIQQDFLLNNTYGEARYDLGITDFSPAGMLAASPAAILTALYRPFIWEAQGALMYLNGAESLLLLALTLLFFFRKGNLLEHVRWISKQEFLVFALIFVVFFGFFIGFTSGLFNVLVRFKAPIIPFFMLFLMANRGVQLRTDK